MPYHKETEMFAKTLAFLSAILDIGQKVLIKTVVTLVLMVLSAVVLLVIFIDVMVHIIAQL